MINRVLPPSIASFPIPAGWSPPEVFVDEIELSGVTLRRAGVQSRNGDGVEVTGSAVERAADPLPRALFELLERTATVDAGVEAQGMSRATSRVSRSNGIALHETWELACAAARLELIERDQVLRAWLGQIALQPTGAPAWLRELHSHEWLAATVTSPEDVEVAVVLGFPHDAAHPLARGFAADEHADASVAKAATEAQQNLAFLWGEPVPSAPPPSAPDAMFHIDHFLWPGHHRVLRAWIAGRPLPNQPSARPRPPLAIGYTDLRPPRWSLPLAVARARAPQALDLVFGAPPETWGPAPFGRGIHPVG